jgi:hypothetical protein
MILDETLSMKISRLPFLLVFAACLLPLASSWINRSLYHLPASLVAAALVVTMTQLPLRKIRIFNQGLLFFAGWVLVTMLAVHVSTGRGWVILANGGYVIMFALVFCVMLANGDGVSLRSMVHATSFLYLFLLFSLVAEAVLVFLGMQPVIAGWLNSTNAPNYKVSNSADILRFFGFMKDAGGLNSVLIGSQIAGMLSLFSLIWFLAVRKLNASGDDYARSRPWIALSVGVLLLTVNGLNFLLLVLAAGGYLFFSIKRKWIAVGVIAVAVLTLYEMVTHGLLLARVFNEDLVHLQPEDIEMYTAFAILSEVASLTTYEYYIFQFANPVLYWFDLGWIDQLIGVGAQHFLTTNKYIAGDFGLGVAMLSSGLIWIAAFLAAIGGICVPALKVIRTGPQEFQNWSVLACANALICMLWLASTIHYNQAFANAGGMTIFALHLSLTAYCRYRCLRTYLSHGSAPLEQPQSIGPLS